MEASRLLIRADVGPVVGTGHVMRTSALASAWVRLGNQVTMTCTRDLPRSLQQRLARSGIGVQLIESVSRVDDALLVRRLAEQLSADWVVLDGYEFDNTYQTIVKQSLAKILVLDDYGHDNHRDADLLLNQNIYAASHQYESVNTDRLLLGARFVLMRDEFVDTPKTEKEVPRLAKQVLVTLGGADHGNMTAVVLRALAKVKNASSLSIDVVIGACNSNGDLLKQLSRELSLNVRLHRNVDRMSVLLERAHLAVTAGGSTCYELARCGVPAMVVVTADNQMAIAKSFDELECMKAIGRSTDLDDESLAQQIDSLVRDRPARESMVLNGRKLVDGQGAGRIARRLFSDQFVIREASETDMSALRLSLDTEDWREGCSAIDDGKGLGDWFGESLGNHLVDFWRIESRSGEKLGFIQLVFDDIGSDCSIQFGLSSDAHCRGWSETLLEAVCRKAFLADDLSEINVTVDTTNSETVSVLERVGFENQEKLSVRGVTGKRFVLARNTIIPVDRKARSSQKKTA